MINRKVEVNTICCMHSTISVAALQLVEIVNWNQWLTSSQVLSVATHTDNMGFITASPYINLKRVFIANTGQFGLHNAYDIHQQRPALIYNISDNMI